MSGGGAAARRILVCGGRGGLGRALARRGGAAGHAIDAPGKDALDVTDAAAIARWLDGGAGGGRYDAVIDAAAFTDVDGAERDRARAFAVNAHGAALVAAACAAREVPLVYVSTDHVFAGAAAAGPNGAAPRAYAEDDAPAPVNVYGASKLGGERAILATAARGARAVIVRTSWLFAPDAAADAAGFVPAIVRRARAERVLRVVADQRGAPTCVDDLADALVALAVRAAAGAPLARCYHVAGAPAVTRHAFALAIVAAARRHGPIACERVDAIATRELPPAAPRPPAPVLDTARAAALGIAAPPWAPGLERAVAALMRAADAARSATDPAGAGAAP